MNEARDWSPDGELEHHGGTLRLLLALGAATGLQLQPFLSEA